MPAVASWINKPRERESKTFPNSAGKYKIIKKKRTTRNNPIEVWATPARSVCPHPHSRKKRKGACRMQLLWMLLSLLLLLTCGAQQIAGDYENTWNFYYEQPCCSGNDMSSHARHKRGNTNATGSAINTQPDNAKLSKVLWEGGNKCIKT